MKGRFLKYICPILLLLSACSSGDTGSISTEFYSDCPGPGCPAAPFQNSAEFLSSQDPDSVNKP